MNVLVIAPHADDEILGVGGTIAKYTANGNDVYICVVTKGCPPLFCDEIANNVQNEAREAHDFLKVKEIFFLDFPAVMLENVPRYELNNKILEVINKVEPEIVYIPHYGDMQKDHQIVSEASMVALRPKGGHSVKNIYSYETLSETEWNIPNTVNAFIPTVWSDISDYLDEKISAMKCFNSQLAEFPNPRSIEAITALAKLRGSNVCLNAAEAFVSIRELI